MMFNSVLDPLVNEGLQTKRDARIRRKRSCMNAAERRGKRKQIFQLIWLYVKFVHFHLILTVKVYSKYFFEALKMSAQHERRPHRSIRTRLWHIAKAAKSWMRKLCRPYCEKYIKFYVQTLKSKFKRTQKSRLKRKLRKRNFATRPSRCRTRRTYVEFLREHKVERKSKNIFY